jgi:protein-disulfide isomerase
MSGAWRLVALLLGLVVTVSPAFAELEKTLVKSDVLNKAPLDIAQSVSDGRLFVLLEGGEVRIFSADGEQQEQFTVDADVTSLEVSPDGQRLYLGKAKSKELQLVDLAYVQQLPVNNSAVKGAVNAPVTITIFSDFQCPYCARLLPTLEKVLETYPQQVRLVFKQFPLSMHKFAQPAAIASIAARNQGKFWPLHDQLFANFDGLSDAKIRELAKGVGLDMARYDKDFANPALQQEIAADIQLGLQSGVRGTPAVFINGKALRDRSFDGFKQDIDAGLKKATK